MTLVCLTLQYYIMLLYGWCMAVFLVLYLYSVGGSIVCGLGIELK